MHRCSWCGEDPLMVAYHDEEWGLPVHDERRLFEYLTLESFQAGLSWRTILKKRENFRKAFDNFDYALIGQYDEMKKGELLRDSGIVRNRLKIEAAVSNALCFQEIQRSFGSFAAYLWAFTAGKPVVRAWENQDQIPATTPLSDRIARDLKKRGFRFLGTTTVYAFLQAVGVVNDHTVDCFRYRDLMHRNRNTI